MYTSPFKRILSILLTVAMVFSMSGMTAFAEELVLPLGTSTQADCHLAHDEACGYIAAVVGADCEHSCELCEAKDSGKAQTPPQGAQLITAFAPLDEAVRYQRATSPVLPETIEAIVDGEPAEIPVIWEAEGYNADAPDVGLYAFYANVSEGYALAYGVELPKITVMLVSRARMAGAGTEANPLQITNASQLAETAELVNVGKLESTVLGSSTATIYLKLMNDLDLSAYGAGYNSGKGWVPIGNVTNRFKGTFDGNGKVITGLYINDNTTDYMGLFGYVAMGTIQNLGVVGGSVTGNNYVGGVAGGISSSITVTNCYATGAVNGNNNNVGGVVGGVYNSTVTNCYATGTVNGSNNNVGGVVGEVIFGTITNCYATGAVSGGTSVGGVAGWGSNSTVTNCAALNPTVKATGSYVGRVIGYLSGSTLSGNIAFSGMGTDGGTAFGGGNALDHIDGLSKTAPEISASGFFQSVFTNDTSMWTFASGKLPGFGAAVDMPGHINETGAPFLGDGTDTDPYLIGTAAELAKLAELVNASTSPYADIGTYYKLTSDIDLSAYGTGWNGGKGWVPIGNNTNYFKGNFDGNGKIITRLYINDSTLDDAGLFGYVGGVTIKNFGVVGGSVTGNLRVGGVAGFAGGSIISNCFATGEVSGNTQIGGVMGAVNSSTVTNCYATGAVIGNNAVGGVVGYAFSSSAVTNCAALNPTVKATGQDVGRVVGYNSSTLSGNIAFGGMGTGGGTAFGGTNTHDGLDGESKTAAEISASGFFQSVFTGDTSMWTFADGKLPGFGGLVDMPVHLIDSGAPFAGGGTDTDPYLIGTAAQLAKLAELVNAGTAPYADSGKYYKLTADIDLSAYGTGYNGGKGWVPIGTTFQKSFNGNFDGNGKVITGLYINDSTANNMGLFGIFRSCTIKNLGIVGGSVSGGVYVGGVVGYVYNSTVTNCYATGSVTGNDYVGGVAGYVEYNNSPVTNCYATSVVSGNDYVGGVVGYASYAYFSSCYATGAVSGNNYVGGVVGYTYYTGVINCVALNPTVKATGSDVARVMGYPDRSFFSANYAFSGMTNGGGTAFGDGNTIFSRDGKSISITDILTTSFWTTAANWNGTAWDTNIWTITNGKLPILKTAGGNQSGDSGLYLTAKDIAGATVATAAFTYNGSEQLPIINFGGVSLVKDVDYTVTITGGTSNGTNAGTVNITITGKGNYSGTKTAGYTISPKPMNAAMVNTIAPQTYDGTAKQPVLSFTDSYVTANDYTAAYSDNVNAGTATVRITPKGNYSGSAFDVNFTMNKATHSLLPTHSVNIQNEAVRSGTVILSSIFGGAANVPLGAVFGTPSGTTNIMMAVTKTDSSTLSYTSNNNAANTTSSDTYTVTITSTNYEDIIATIVFQATDKTVVTIGGLTAPSKTYDGNAITNAAFGTATFTPSWTGTLEYSYYTGGDTTASSISAPKNAGDYTLVVKIPDSDVGNIGVFEIPFTIAKKAATVKPKDFSVIMGGTMPTFELAYTGLVSGESITPSEPPTFSCTAADTNTIGTYAITWSNEAATSFTGDENYIVTKTATGTLTINSQYTVTIDAMTNGTVTANPTVAAPGTTIHLTVTPSNGYRLKDGTLKYNDTAITGNSFTMPADNVTITAEFELITPNTYTVTVTNGTGSGRYTVGVVVTISASHMPNYSFTHWTASGATLANANSSTTSFVMPSANVSVTANYVYIGGSDPTPTPTYDSTPTSNPTPTLYPTPTQAPQPDQPKTEVSIDKNTVTVVTEIKPEVKGNTASAAISSNTITEAVKAATDSAKTGGTAVTVEIKVSAPQTATTVEATIPKTAFSELAKSADNVTISTPFATINFNDKALLEIAKAASNDITVTASIVDKTTLPEATQLLVGNKPVYDFTVKAGEKLITDFGNGKATITIPYNLAAGEKTNSIVIYYINSKGELEVVKNCKYDAATGTVSFITTHFSRYAVAYKPVSFNDVSGSDWFVSAVDFVASRELFSGMGNNDFASASAMNRAMFVTVLARLDGDDLNAYVTSVFSDVDINEWYGKSIAWATSNSIVSGVENGMFAPNREITREEMAVMLYNYMKYKGITVPDTGNNTPFNDSDKVSVWAQDAVAEMKRLGLIGGVGGNNYAPKDTANRASVATIFMNFINALLKR